MIYDKGARTITWENVLEKLYIHMQQNEVVPLPKIQKITQNRSKTSVWFSSVTQSCPTLCNPMNRSMPGLPVRHQLLEFTQKHVHWVSDAIQPSHPPSSPSPPALNLSQHQRVGSWHQVAKVLEFQLQHQSSQWMFRADFLSGWLIWSPWCPRDSQESSPAPKFKSINSSGLSLLYSPILTSVHDYWKNHSFSK